MMLKSISPANQSKIGFKAVGYYIPASPSGKLGHTQEMTETKLDKSYVEDYVKGLNFAIERKHVFYKPGGFDNKGLDCTDRFTCDNETIVLSKCDSDFFNKVSIEHGKKEKPQGITEIYRNSSDDTVFDSLIKGLEGVKNRYYKNK